MVENALVQKVGLGFGFICGVFHRGYSGGAIAVMESIDPFVAYFVLCTVVVLCAGFRKDPPGDDA